MLTCVGSDEIARLRRLAFGSGSGVQERTDAMAALRALSDRTAAESAGMGEPESEFYAHTGAQPVETDHLVSAIGNESRDGSIETVVDEDAEKSIWQRRIWFGWLVPVTVGALLLGVVGGLGAAGQFDPSDAKAVPTAPPTVSAVTGRSWGLNIPDSGGGHIDAANAVFDVPAKGYEAYPITSLLSDMGVDQSQVRLAVVDNGHKLWVVKQGTIGFCLASYDVRTSDGMYECATIEKFKRSGVAMIGTEFAAWWDGKSFVISG